MIFKGIWVILAFALAVWCTGCSGSDNSSEEVVEGKNVKFIESVFPTDESWAEAFPIAATNPSCTGAATLSRAHFLSAAAGFPAFCGSESAEKNEQELAAFLANVSLETNGAAKGGTDGGLCFDSEVGCVYPGCTPGTNCCDYCSDLAPPYDKYHACPYGYFGRGALQITNPVNYEEAGQALHDFDPITFPDPNFLVMEPVKILEGDTAWRASLNFWMNHAGGFETSGTSVGGKMTCHEAMVDHNDFGKTVEIINGNLECRNPSEPFQKKTQWRIDYYEHYVRYLFDPPVQPTKHVKCAGSSGPSDPTSRCGKGWADANSNCRTCCSVDADCPDEYPKCYAQLANPTPAGAECSCGTGSNLNGSMN
ncbi:MAG: chitinase [Pseudomonadota bacterium]